MGERNLRYRNRSDTKLALVDLARANIDAFLIRMVRWLVRRNTVARLHSWSYDHPMKIIQKRDDLRGFAARYPSEASQRGVVGTKPRSSCFE